MMNKLSKLLMMAVFFAIYSYSPNANAQISQIFKGVKMGDPLETVKAKLANRCASTQTYTSKNPSFPLAKQKEAHLICKNYRMSKNSVAFDEVAFVFADGKLCLIEARGNLTKRLAFNEFYKGYKFFIHPDMMAIQEATKTVWFLTKEGAHPNLFAWSNPYFKSSKVKKYTTSAKVPAMFEFGKGVKALKPLFEKKSSFIDTQVINKNRTQLNCFGVEYAGFPRKVEAVFKKDKLSLLWILTAKQEEDRIRQHLVKAYGKPIHTNNDWEVFNNWQVMLRKDKPEVLVIAKESIPEYKKRMLEKAKK